MKKRIFAFAALSIAAMTDTATLAAPANDRDLLCQAMATLAENVMKNRQNGIPMGTALTILAKVENAEVIKFTRAIIVDAYDRPHYSTEEVKQKTIGDFRDAIHVSCLQAVASKS